jgi:hypothetical protein
MNAHPDRTMADQSFSIMPLVDHGLSTGFASSFLLFSIVSACEELLVLAMSTPLPAGHLAYYGLKKIAFEEKCILRLYKIRGRSAVGHSRRFAHPPMTSGYTGERTLA